MDKLVEMVFGSHLYGTAHEESDKDFKGVYLPSLEDCFLNRIKKSIHNSTGNDNEKNTKDDIDREYYSLQYFMQLAKAGEMIVIDMIHAPWNMITKTSSLWEEIRCNRSRFYSKNLSGYLGYVRKQAAKYSVKGSRLAAMSDVIKFLDNCCQEYKLSLYWEAFPVNEYCDYVDNPKEKRWRHYQCCGKILHETMTVNYASDIIKNMYDKYGARAKMAEQNKGLDWKAISHAFRAGLQLKEIYATGDLKYPLADCEFLRDLKLGKYHYKNDKIGERLDDMLVEIETLSKESVFPEAPGVGWMEQLVINSYTPKMIEEL